MMKEVKVATLIVSLLFLVLLVTGLVIGPNGMPKGYQPSLVILGALTVSLGLFSCYCARKEIEEQEKLVSVV